MPDLTARQRASLPDSAFAYVDGRGKRLLPIHDEAHVRNALARFNRTHFEDEAARHRARRRLLRAARRHGIVPDGFISAQLEPQRRLPRGNLTLLLCDVEGSTQLAAQLGDGFADVLAELRRLIRRHVRRRGGHEVDARADEYFAVFERPAAALLTAVDVQASIANRSWPPGIRPRLRMGLHSGRPSLTSEGYVGLAVHAAARVCSAGHGGQIVISQAAVYALGTEMPAGMHLRSLGVHALRGLPQRVELYQLFAPGLDEQFPALRL